MKNYVRKPVLPRNPDVPNPRRLRASVAIPCLLSITAVIWPVEYALIALYLLASLLSALPWLIGAGVAFFAGRIKGWW